MFTITTATGKHFNSDYATSIKNPLVGFVRIVGETFETVNNVFEDKKELPLDIFPEFNNVATIIDEGDGVKLVLEVKDVHIE